MLQAGGRHLGWARLWLGQVLPSLALGRDKCSQVGGTVSRRLGRGKCTQGVRLNWRNLVRADKKLMRRLPQACSTAKPHSLGGFHWVPRLVLSVLAARVEVLQANRALPCYHWLDHRVGNSRGTC